MESLTAKERKILQLIADAKTQKKVAIQLYMSQRTISTHMQHILNKLCVHSTVSAVIKALELGVVEINSEKAYDHYFT
ncbi:LuxR C-terminal-related transcriptional regulator [Candidatus Enterococcus courvalinii]|uniref:Response regulator transcription factor n=1 Tax=Candidatus Enterococcus courvalinii TaxID=2815329 RepID=A0ABS3I0H7_9ENTE|nr:response regulator transcription factor [Enterococcus sp. MSG2901]